MDVALDQPKPIPAAVLAPSEEMKELAQELRQLIAQGTPDKETAARIVADGWTKGRQLPLEAPVVRINTAVAEKMIEFLQKFADKAGVDHPAIARQANEHTRRRCSRCSASWD
jgi:hypothetical protein